jgi:hypothetical protein
MAEEHRPLGNIVILHLEENHPQLLQMAEKQNLPSVVVSFFESFA